MKKLLKFAVILMAVGLIFGFAGCGDDGDGDGSGDASVSFENNAAPSIRVENLTNNRLVAFKGSLNPNYLIGGIPAYSGVHGLKKDPALFNTTGSFVMLLITEEQYNANKNNLGALNNSVFARIFAFYNHTATNNNVFQISSTIGGDAVLSVSNGTPYEVEIRMDGPTGEILGYVAANMVSGNNIYLNTRSYDIFPIFKFFDRVNEELYSVTPKYTSGVLEGKPFSKTVGFGPGMMARTFNVDEIYEEGSFNLTSGSVYFRINNNNTGTDVRFWEGDVLKITSVGVDVIYQSRAEQFTLRFTRNPDGTYPESRTIAGLQIGTNQNRLTVPSQLYDLDYMYEIDVLGNNASNMTLSEIRKGNKVNLEAIFGIN